MMDRVCDGLPPAFPINGIVVVGVCAAGKTTLFRELQGLGIPVRAVAQEHSLVRGLFRCHGRHPLVLLTADWETVHRRRRLAWEPAFYRVEWLRLEEARSEADLIVQTDYRTPRQVADAVCRWWDRRLGLDRLAVDPATRAEVRRLAAWGLEWRQFSTRSQPSGE